jgi:protocatechuate 3,4-dioxygenase, alpha subunit
MIVSPISTIGPYFPFEFADDMCDLTSLNGVKAQGEHITITGKVLEEGGAGTLNSIVEIWQPDAAGILRHPNDPRFVQADPGFRGFGRARTMADGSFTLRTVLPGAGNGRAPHINVSIMAIGLTWRYLTTLFFSDSPDPVLDCVPKERRSLLIAQRQADGSYRFDINLRGENETPFFQD